MNVENESFLVILKLYMIIDHVAVLVWNHYFDYIQIQQKIRRHFHKKCLGVLVPKCSSENIIYQHQLRTTTILFWKKKRVIPTFDQTLNVIQRNIKDLQYRWLFLYQLRYVYGPFFTIFPRKTWNNHHFSNSIFKSI